MRKKNDERMMQIYNYINDFIINAEKADGVTFFADENALDDYVSRAIADLREHPAFAGISLQDEPHYNQFDAIADVYKSFKRVCPKGEVMINLLPMTTSVTVIPMYCENANELPLATAYKNYLQSYYDKIGKYCGYVQIDDYPILTNGILSTFLNCQQILSDFAKEKGLETRMVLQTCKYADRRMVTADDMYWQLNISAAFGAKEFSYYTYYPTVNINGTLPDESGFVVTRTGERNPIYYDLQKIHAEMQFYAKALTHFNYQGMRFYTLAPLPNGMGYLSGLSSDKLSHVKNCAFKMSVQSGGVVLITELYDEENERYGYYVVNITEPAYPSEAAVTVQFENYKNAQVYQYSEIINTKLDNGNLTLNLGPGRGAFVIPF